MNLINSWSGYIVLAENKELDIWDRLPIALLNTVLGMGTVFMVLILILGLISLLKYVPVIVNKFMGIQDADKAANTVISNTVIPKMNTENRSNLMQDAQLVAAITAAITAYRGNETPEDGFIVRSIRRR